MSELHTSTASSGDEQVRWRLADPSDMPFVYRLVTQVDPRWYRFSRHGLEPSGMLGLMASIAGGAIVHDWLGEPVACALLADSSESGTGHLEYYALPTAHAEHCAALAAPDLLGALFSASSPRRLYVERFENDPHILGEAEHLFTTEVVLPRFMLIDGTYEDRTTLVLTADDWWAWHDARTEDAP
ncbi:MAG TPA: hypothetical protein PK020_18400 [Ilumatobacteraceae bacterium]|nr:hypothetical protein [Ilumatobacteraceae bacterium]HRB05067.1 hypothetical protein [Ilumatobacteraceae bacterium]